MLLAPQIAVVWEEPGGGRAASAVLLYPVRALVRDRDGFSSERPGAGGEPRWCWPLGTGGVAAIRRVNGACRGRPRSQAAIEELGDRQAARICRGDLGAGQETATDSSGQANAFRQGRQISAAHPLSRFGPKAALTERTCGIRVCRHAE